VTSAMLSTPTTAERVRSACVGAAAAILAAGAEGIAAVLELTDYAPLPLREPVRSLVWIRGQVHSVPPGALRELLDLIATARPDPALLEVGAGQTLLLLGADSVVVADSTGAEPVRLTELLAAAPDPFRHMESAWLRHLDSDHPEVMARLRVGGADGDHDVRLPFPAPVHDVGGLGRAIRVLMGCPFVNGLRARRL
jgi:hypothetical protein